jgi:hypothetical protein
MTLYAIGDAAGVKGQHASRRRWPAVFLMDDLPASFPLANFYHLNRRSLLTSI